MKISFVIDKFYLFIYGFVEAKATRLMNFERTANFSWQADISSLLVLNRFGWHLQAGECVQTVQVLVNFEVVELQHVQRQIVLLSDFQTWPRRESGFVRIFTEKFAVHRHSHAARVETQSKFENLLELKGETAIGFGIWFDEPENNFSKSKLSRECSKARSHNAFVNWVVTENFLHRKPSIEMETLCLGFADEKLQRKRTGGVAAGAGL